MAFTQKEIESNKNYPLPFSKHNRRTQQRRTFLTKAAAFHE
jgi:hypothetical protein